MFGKWPGRGVNRGCTRLGHDHEDTGEIRGQGHATVRFQGSAHLDQTAKYRQVNLMKFILILVLSNDSNVIFAKIQLNIFRRASSST